MTTMMTVELCNGFEHVIINLDHTREPLPTCTIGDNGQPHAEISEGDVYWVTGTGFYATAHGARVGDTRKFSYRDADEAKAKANGWFTHLIGQGFQRVK